MSSTAREKITWGILGTAGIATKVSQAMQLADNATPMAVASRDLERARQWATEHGLDQAYGSYEDLLEDPEIDAVYIPLPPSMHHEWTIKAAEKGKHVLCEKPLALSAGQARAMAAACREHQVQLMDGVMWVHHERTAMMKKFIDDNALGALRRVTAAFSFNWDEIPEHNIRVSKELGGGTLGDLGYYCVRAILWAFDDLPTSVYAAARYYNQVDFNLSGLLFFDDQRIASFDCGFDTAFRRWFEVAGNHGSLVCDDFVIPAREESARFWLHGSGDQEGRHEVKDCIQEVRMIETFSQLVRTGQLDEHWPRQAIATMQVCDALLESARQDKRMELDHAH